MPNVVCQGAGPVAVMRSGGAISVPSPVIPSWGMLTVRSFCNGSETVCSPCIAVGPGNWTATAPCWRQIHQCFGAQRGPSSLTYPQPPLPFQASSSALLAVQQFVDDSWAAFGVPTHRECLSSLPQSPCWRSRLFSDLRPQALSQWRSRVQLFAQDMTCLSSPHTMSHELSSQAPQSPLYSSDIAIHSLSSSTLLRFLHSNHSSMTTHSFRLRTLFAPETWGPQVNSHFQCFCAFAHFLGAIL